MTGYRVKVKISDAGIARNECKSSAIIAPIPIFPQLRESHRIKDVSSWKSAGSMNSMARNPVSHFKSSRGLRGISTLENPIISMGVSNQCSRSRNERSSQISASIPVQSRRGSIRKNQTSSSTDECSMDSQSEDDASNNNTEQLKKIYDMRTWDMYTRITEARKKKKPLSVLIPHARSTGISIQHVAASATVEHLDDVHSDRSVFQNTDDDANSTFSSEHEMVFALEE